MPQTNGGSSFLFRLIILLYFVVLQSRLFFHHAVLSLIALSNTQPSFSKIPASIIPRNNLNFICSFVATPSPQLVRTG
jgi:hypothetical protein